MESIIQTDKTRCFICGQNANGDPLDKHHVFSGNKRKQSEKYGLTVYIHHNKCHIFGRDAVHQNAEVCKRLQRMVQYMAMKHYGWDKREFRQKFGKSYI